MDLGKERRNPVCIFSSQITLVIASKPKSGFEYEVAEIFKICSFHITRIPCFSVLERDVNREVWDFKIGLHLKFLEPFKIFLSPERQKPETVDQNFARD